ncbi:MAG TPA: DUF3515 domain-containing protein [Candidatus Stackebrandtia faecavium]|nr:DUF3515 domain-containing protein [Candidatus Stackebrandtia faecavium]
MASDDDSKAESGTEKPKESESDRINQSDRRRAAGIATLVAVPVTILAAIGAFAVVGNATENEQPDEDHAVPSEAVTVDVPELSDEQYEYCRALISVLPDELADEPRRTVTGDAGAAEIAAAWGDPAITLHCGVSEVEVEDTANVYRLDATCWYAEESEESTTWSTVDRELPVKLEVPADYTESGQLAQAVSSSVAEKLPAIKDVPSGCSA